MKQYIITTPLVPAGHPASTPRLVCLLLQEGGYKELIAAKELPEDISNDNAVAFLRAVAAALWGMGRDVTLRDLDTAWLKARKEMMDADVHVRAEGEATDPAEDPAG